MYHERKESMLSRIRYALSKYWQNRAQLQRYCFSPELQLTSVLDLSVADLTALGIKALVLDFDGVLASHAEPEPRAEVAYWLNKLQRDFAPHQIYILSNKPTRERQNYFAKNFPGIIFIIAARKKPYPDGLQQIVTLSGLAAGQVLLIDDRLATGILAVIISGVRGLWLTKPYTNFVVRPMVETWFMCLRGLERFGCKII